MSLAPGAPRIQHGDKVFYLLDGSPVGRALGSGADPVHLMGVERDGELAVFAAAPDFVARLLAEGTRLPPEE